jgi:hypothetical protein
MIPYTAQENEYLSSGSYRKSNQNRQRKVQEQDQQWYLPKHGYAIKTTIEVDGKEYIVPVQL